MLSNDCRSHLRFGIAFRYNLAAVIHFSFFYFYILDRDHFEIESDGDGWWRCQRPIHRRHQCLSGRLCEYIHRIDDGRPSMIRFTSMSSRTHFLLWLFFYSINVYTILLGLVPLVKLIFVHFGLIPVMKFNFLPLHINDDYLERSHFQSFEYRSRSLKRRIATPMSISNNSSRNRNKWNSPDIDGYR